MSISRKLYIYEAVKENKLEVKEEQVEVEKNQKEKIKRRRSTCTSFLAKAEDFANVQEIDQRLSQYVVRGEDGIFSCGFCGKSGVKTKQNLISHLEIHIEGLSFSCPTCDKKLK